MEKNRIWELDFLRGFAIILMIFDHLMYDLKNLEYYFSNFAIVNLGIVNWLVNIAHLYWYSNLRFVGHIFFITLFLLISGISFTFSKSNLKRGLSLGVFALLISLVTYLIDLFSNNNTFIIFGIIHMYAASILITYFLRKLWNNNNFIFFVGVFVIALGIYNQFWVFNYIPKLSIKEIPGIIYGTKAYGADDFGIVPYSGLIMIGTVLGNIYYKNKMSLIPNSKIGNNNFVNWVGRHSLWIFLLHQFVLFGLIYGLGYLLGYQI